MQTTPALPTLAPGEIYAGPVLEDGCTTHHLVLLPNRPTKKLESLRRGFDYSDERAAHQSLEGSAARWCRMTTLHPYRIRCAGLEYIAMATGAAQAIADAIALHRARGASAKPLNYVFSSGRADCIRTKHPQQRFFAIQGGAA